MSGTQIGGGRVRAERLRPRERVLLALAHQETDRAPVDFLATPEAAARLKAHLAVADDEQMLARLGVDIRQPRQPYIGPPLRRDADGNAVDAWGIARRTVEHDGGAYEEISRHPLADLTDASLLDQYPWPDPRWWDAEALAAEVRRLQDYAIALPEFGDPGGIFEIAWYLRGMERFLVDMAEEPDIAWEIMRRVADYYVAAVDRVAAACGERIDLIWTSDDIAHQQGPLISRKLWLELIAPHHERLNRRVRESGMRVMYHSCGAVRSFIPDLIRIGVDVLDVLQLSARGMDAEEIKSSFGRDLCFHGGMDVQGTLPFGSEEDVRRAARRLIDTMGRGGGFILSPTHNIQVDTPPANIVAMYREAGSLL